MLIVYIMRGLPGSGKSTIAKRLVPADHIFSTDSYFIDSDGVYRFDPTKLAINHRQNRDRFVAVTKTLASPLAVDNTNMTPDEMKPYVDAAEAAGYQVVEIVVGNPKDPWHQLCCTQRNVHGVPLEAIERMGRRFRR